MKCTKGKLTGIAIVTLLILAACQKNKNEKVPVTGSDRQQAGGTADSTLTSNSRVAWFPVGTIFKPIPGGLHGVPPENWSYIGTSPEGKSIYLQNKATSSITCTCNMGVGSCKPFAATGPWGTTRGCVGTCTNCTMSQNVIQVSPVEVASGGYFQRNEASRLLKHGERAPAVFDELLNLPEFQQRLKSFYDRAYNGAKIQLPVSDSVGSITAPDGYSLVGASIMGRGIGVILPEDYVRQELGYTVKTKASCKCSNATGACTLQNKTILGMGSIWCDGSCNGCTLTTSTNLYQVDLFSVNL